MIDTKKGIKYFFYDSRKSQRISFHKDRIEVIENGVKIVDIFFDLMLKI